MGQIRVPARTAVWRHRLRRELRCLAERKGSGIRDCEEIRQLLVRGKEKGSLSYGEIQESLGDREDLDSAAMDEMYQLFAEAG
ncbi:MAG: RNA polymerase sigma factor region1.1 domain-containing protein, partial [Armatimonadota bacterium]